MKAKKSYQLLKQLNEYGQGEADDSLSFLVQQNLIKHIKNQYIITNNWITFSQQFQSEQHNLLSLFCFNVGYQRYLLEVALLTALKMSEIEEIEGITTFTSDLPKLSAYGICVLEEIKENNMLSIARLEARLKQKDEKYKELNHFIFDGPPHYQRVMFYLKHIQAYRKEDIEEVTDIGKKIDTQWQRGRKISTDLSLSPLKENTLYTLVPFIPERRINHPQFHYLFTYPWKLFVFLCCIVREHFEAQGVQAVRFQVVGDEVDVLLTSSTHQQYIYGTFNEFAVEFCKVNQYQLFPYEIKNLQTVFQNLSERKLLSVVDGEYRLPTEVEDVIYNTSVYIPLIAESKQLRSRIEQWINELREYDETYSPFN